MIVLALPQTEEQNEVNSLEGISFLFSENSS